MNKLFIRKMKQAFSNSWSCFDNNNTIVLHLVGKKTLLMHLYLLRKHFDPHARVLRKGDRKEANVSCLDWTIQCVLYNGIQVGIRLEDL